ncbi:MAG: sigma-70 family RNA polymerase sigma factor [Myxococcales bacterium]|nr:sigma-70 family RNA polymerase sigma factor [Myxococcales bacterium]
MKNASDSALVEQALQGDQAAFGELYLRYRGAVHAIALARLSPHEAGDLVQDVFERALSRLRKLRKPSAFRSWLLMIARNGSIDYYRKRKPMGDNPELISQESPPHAEAMQIIETIRKFPDAYRETLIMRLVEGMTGPEIAERTGLRPESVRVNLHRGMKLLRDALGVEVEQ